MYARMFVGKIKYLGTNETCRGFFRKAREKKTNPLPKRGESMKSMIYKIKTNLERLGVQYEDDGEVVVFQIPLYKPVEDFLDGQKDDTVVAVSYHMPYDGMGTMAFLKTQGMDEYGDAPADPICVLEDLEDLEEIEEIVK